MSIILIIILFIVVIVATVGITAFFLFRFRRSDNANKTTNSVTPAARSENIPFKWNYILLPLIVLLISVILSTYFYPRLPDEVALQLGSSDSTSRWLSRGLILVLTIVPQTLLVVLGAGIVFLITKLGLLSKQGWGSKMSREKLLWFMGNIPAIPQASLCFTMFNIFYYNAYQTQLLPVWLFLVITLGISGVILGIFLVFTFIRIKQKPATQIDRIEEIQDDG